MSRSQNRCGCCLITNVPLSETFLEPHYKDIYNVKFSIILKQLYTEFEFGSDLCYSVCKNCSTLVKDTYLFKKLVLRNQYKYAKYIKSITKTDATLQTASTSNAPNFESVIVDHVKFDAPINSNGNNGDYDCLSVMLKAEEGTAEQSPANEISILNDYVTLQRTQIDSVLANKDGHKTDSNEIKIEPGVIKIEEEELRPLATFQSYEKGQSVHADRDVTIQNIKNSISKKKYYKKNFCPFCFKQEAHFPRHLLRKHKNIEEVNRILALPLRSEDRRTALVHLIRRGNFLMQQRTNGTQWKPVRRIKGLTESSQYSACTSCLGFFKRETLWRHRKVCKLRLENPDKEAKSNGRQNHLSVSQTFTATVGNPLGSFINSSRIKHQVLNAMRPDKISYTAKTDPLICLYGEALMVDGKTRSEVSNKMRTMARLKMALKKTDQFNSLIECLKPNAYGSLLTAAKFISGYDSESSTAKSPGLITHIGPNLRYLCDVAENAIICNSPLFEQVVDPLETGKSVRDLRDAISFDWSNDIATALNKKPATVVRIEENNVAADENNVVAAAAADENESSNSDKNKKQSNRVRWKPVQKRLVLKHFSYHIQYSILPKKHECVKFVEKHKLIFEPDDWKRVKILVYNSYRMK